MCLSAQALALFLNLLAHDAIVTSPDRIVIRSEVREAHWVPVADLWCTMAPQIDRMSRSTKAASAR